MSSKQYYPQPNQNMNVAKIEEDVLKFWQDEQVFERSVEYRDSGNEKDREGEFVFYDGPPFANGLPHYGHVLTGYIKDTFARYQTTKGKKVERRFGWDTHGLPVEMQTEKELEVSGKQAINEYGIDNFNQHCRESVMRYAGEWKNYVTRMGRWVDFDGGYKTMDVNFMESVIWAFKQLYDKGLLYEDYRVMPYSWMCQTPLSNFETRMDNSYREKADKAGTIAFKMKEVPSFIDNKWADANVCKALAWTTTPWTLPSNLALAVGKDIDYVAIKKDEEVYLIADALKNKYAKELKLSEDGSDEMFSFKGSELIGLKYEPILPYIAELPEVKESKNAFTIIAADYVTTEDGTGIVHTAPGFGEDDQNACKAYGIPTVCPVDDAGKFDSRVGDYTGQHVFDTNDAIIIQLKEQGSWIRTEQYLHNYPFCWRTDSPLIYKAMSSWYVRVSDFKDRMVELNQQINWIPEHIKDGQFGKWLEGARDWSITRNRYWGCPVPVWKSDDPSYPRVDVYGSLDELERDFGVRPTNLHRPYIDELTRPNPDDPTGKSTMRRVTDVLDCWFESGSMPYAQKHYPFENKDWFENHFPADFITEYIGQTRGWFYTLLVLSTALFDRPPFRNCICHGIVLDENSKKLSKRLGNYTDPLKVFDMYGSDALRWHMLSGSPIMHGQNLSIRQDVGDVRDTFRISIKPIWNAYNFFCLYANSDGIKAKRISESDNLLDRYILAKLKSAVQNIEKYMDNYDTSNACIETEKFFETLNNWYIRRNRNRFWKSEIDLDKQVAYDTLYTVLLTICEATSSLLPFTTESIWRGLTHQAN